MMRLIRQEIDSALSRIAMRVFRWRTHEKNLLWSKLKSRFHYPFKFDADVVLVGNEAMVQQGWILRGICDELMKHLPMKCMFSTDVHHLPTAKAYYFAHYGLLELSMIENPHIWNVPRVALFTHKLDDEVLSEQQLLALNSATSIVAMCTLFRDELIKSGVSSSSVVVALMGADPSKFIAHKRSGGVVGICNYFMPRKSPDTLLEVVRMAPMYNFLHLGRHWNEYSRFSELVSLPNYKYFEAPYSEYPAFYDKIDVFLSASKKEGGPIPLIEAMMSNVVPVASRTGFAPDIIRHGENGYIFDVNAPARDIVDLIAAAMMHQGDIRSSVLHLTWRRFSEQLAPLFKISRN